MEHLKDNKSKYHLDERFPIVFAQVKWGKTSDEFLNDIRQNINFTKQKKSQKRT